jgi:hypothetical protein
MGAMTARKSTSVAVCVLALVAACGGAAKPAESGTEPSASAEPAKPAASADAPDTKAAAAKADATKPSAPVDDSPKPTRTPEDILTAPDVLFLFSFNDSEPKQVAEDKCTKKAGNDAKKMNQCMAGERKQFPADGYRFKKDESGHWWWITVRQTGNRLVALHKIPVEIGEQTDKSVTLKPVGKDKGTKPMTPPAKVVFEVPNDYQIAIQDPKHGRLVFQAKVGVVTE